MIEQQNETEKEEEKSLSLMLLHKHSNGDDFCLIFRWSINGSLVLKDDKK